ncbi:unnamed protein product [Clonostachys byssicola]|uniref:Enoyl reductase (ER) domain-containing protein n=1 Tax=Clonostachys byssicola TaxID=160290 RepID=A0A9N9V1A6_9HYPO|nr:unnamed protein product [Clonostachys byssicola]
MAHQAGLVIDKPGDTFWVVRDIRPPSPGKKQVLVKSQFVALNPIEVIMAQSGILTTEMPAILGSDFCGIVDEVGSDCTKLQVGDHVFGLCRLGQNPYSPFQDKFLVDEDLAFKRPERVDAEVAASVGVGVLTSAYGIIVGGDVALPKPGQEVNPKDEWIVVLGGSGTVGQYAIQLARLCGYKVAASCSTANVSTVERRGANASFNSRSSSQSQAEEIQKITGGDFSLVFDASGVSQNAALAALKNSTRSKKYFSTVDDFTEIDVPGDIKEYRVEAGHLGRDTTLGRQVTDEATRMIPLLEGHIEYGAIVPVDCELYKESGWGALAEAIAYFQAGHAKKKLIVRVQD